MSGPIYSDDGYWMWNGTEWIPATQAQNVVPTQQIDQNAVANAATQVGVPEQQVAAVAPHFDLNQDGQIDQNEMMQAAQSIANPVNVAAPNQATMGMPAQGGNLPHMGGIGEPVQSGAVPNMGGGAMPMPVMAGPPKKVFDWKEKKVLLVGGIVTVTVAIGVLVFFLLSGNPIVGTWVGNSGEITYNKDGTVQSEIQAVQTWETDDNKLIQTVTSTLPNGSKMTTITTAQYELSDGNDVLWMNVTSMVDQDGNNMLMYTDAGGNEVEIIMPCVVALRDSIAKDSAEYNSTIASYQSSKPSWC